MNPRGLPLFAFGGAGPGHGFGVASILHSPRMLVPFGAGVTSAMGFLTAPLAFDFVSSFLSQLDSVDWDHINELFSDMAAQGDAILARSGVPADERRISRQADVRYARLQPNPQQLALVKWFTAFSGTKADFGINCPHSLAFDGANMWVSNCTNKVSVLRASDGFFTVGATTRPNWEACCEVFGLQQLKEDPRFALLAF